MWAAIVLGGLILLELVVYLLYCVYSESDEDFHPESHAHRGSI